MVDMYTKFDEKTSNGVVSIVFTRSMHGRKDGTTEALLYPHRNALLILMWKGFYLNLNYEAHEKISIYLL